MRFIITPDLSFQQDILYRILFEKYLWGVHVSPYLLSRKNDPHENSWGSVCRYRIVYCLCFSSHVRFFGVPSESKTRVQSVQISRESSFGFSTRLEIGIAFPPHERQRTSFLFTAFASNLLNTRYQDLQQQECVRCWNNCRNRCRR